MKTLPLGFSIEVSPKDGPLSVKNKLFISSDITKVFGPNKGYPSYSLTSSETSSSFLSFA